MCLIWYKATIQINSSLGRPYSDFNIYDRLLVLCLLENNGVLQLAREFGGSSKLKGFTNERIEPAVSRVAQIVASIPDKARMNSPTSLSSQYPFSFLGLASLWVLCVDMNLQFFLLD